MKLLKKNPFVLSIIVIVLLCVLLIGLAFYVKGLWVEKGVPLDEEEASSILDEIGQYAEVITELNAYESFDEVEPGDQAIIAYKSGSYEDFLLDKEGNVIFGPANVTLDADVVMVWSEDGSFVTTLDELKKGGTFKKFMCNEAEASENGKYIIAYIGTIVDEKRQIVILNRDFEKLCELTKKNEFPNGADVTYEIEDIFFTETTEDDGWCYVRDIPGGYRYDLNILTGEKTDWYEVPPEEVDIEYEAETYEGFPLWALNKRTFYIYWNYSSLSHTKADKKRLFEAKWHRLHDLGLKPELEDLLRKFGEVDVLGEGYLAAYTYAGGTLIKLGDESYE